MASNPKLTVKIGFDISRLPEAFSLCDLLCEGKFPPTGPECHTYKEIKRFEKDQGIGLSITECGEYCPISIISTIEALRVDLADRLVAMAEVITEAFEELQEDLEEIAHDKT